MDKWTTQGKKLQQNLDLFLQFVSNRYKNTQFSDDIAKKRAVYGTILVLIYRTAFNQKQFPQFISLIYIYSSFNN